MPYSFNNIRKDNDFDEMKFESCCRLEKAKSLVRLVDLLDSLLPLGGKAHRKSHQSGELSGLKIYG